MQKINIYEAIRLAIVENKKTVGYDMAYVHDNRAETYDIENRNSLCTDLEEIEEELKEMIYDDPEYGNKQRIIKVTIEALPKDE